MRGIRRAGLALAVVATAAAAAEPELPAIVVTAARRAMPEVEAPASLSVVTRREIEARGADTVLEAVRGEAGLALQGRAIGGRQVLSLRGLDSKHTLFLVDGRRIGASDGVIGHSDFQYDWIAAADIERIEIVRGPLSVLYGSEALGGVVNVITREPGAAWRGGASAEGRGAEGGRGGGGHRVAVSVDGPLIAEGGATLGLRAGAAHTRRSAIASEADPRISELEGREKTDGWAGLVWRPAAGQRLDAELRGGREDRNADARERSGARRYHLSENLIHRSLTSLGWEAEWGAAASPTAAAPLATQLRAYRATLDVDNRRSAGVAINPPQRIDDRVLEGQGRWESGAQIVTAGFEAHDEALDDPGLPGGRAVARQRSLFVQDELTLAPALRLTAGLRHDRHALFGSEWSPRAYLVWRGEEGWVIKGGYGHGFKAPNLKQIVPGARREGPNDFLGNPALRPETSQSVELGIGWQAAQGGRGRALQAVLFEQRVDDLIEVRLVAAGAVPGTGTYTYENLTRARMRGVETSLTEPLTAWLGLRLSYTYLDAASGDGRRLDKRPRHSATLALDAGTGQADAAGGWSQWKNWSSWNHWRAGLRVEYSADQRLPAATAGAPSVVAPDLLLLGAQITHAVAPGFEVTLGVDNLTDVRLSEKSALFQQAEPPRTWRLALKGRW